MWGGRWGRDFHAMTASGPLPLQAADKRFSVEGRACAKARTACTEPLFPLTAPAFHTRFGDCCL